MIHDALKFLVDQLNEYLYSKLGENGLVVRKRLVERNGNEVADNNKIICQLVNVDEERVGKSQVPLAPPIGGIHPVRNPEIKLNLSILFTAMSPNESAGEHSGTEEDGEYGISLKLLAYVVQYFQYKHYFTTENSPSLPASIGNLVVELYPMTLETQNYLWASLGAKYRPSVVYKVRLLTIFEDTFTDVVGTPVTVDINSRTIN